jgi:hypothetical protein
MRQKNEENIKNEGMKKYEKKARRTKGNKENERVIKTNKRRKG